MPAPLRDFDLFERDCFQKCRFFSGRFIEVIRDGKVVLMHMPLIFKQLAKSTTIRHNLSQDPYNHLYTNLLGKKTEYSCCPLLDMLGEWYCQTFPKSKTVKTDHDGSYLWPSLPSGVYKWDNNTLSQLCLAYSVEKLDFEDLIQSFTEFLENYKTKSNVFDHWLLKHVLEVDLE